MKNVVNHEPGEGFNETQKIEIYEQFESMWKEVAVPDLHRIVHEHNETEKITTMWAQLWPVKIGEKRHLLIPYIAVSALAIALIALIH